MAAPLGCCLSSGGCPHVAPSLCASLCQKLRSHFQETHVAIALGAVLERLQIDEWDFPLVNLLGELLSVLDHLVVIRELHDKVLDVLAVNPRQRPAEDKLECQIPIDERQVGVEEVCGRRVVDRLVQDGAQLVVPNIGRRSRRFLANNGWALL